MTKVFIDGSAGTTGLRIYERLGSRPDLELMILPDELRKDPAARAEILNAADVAFLCLPDQAAREAVELVTSPNTVVIDTSTAHRTNPAWAYGFPELTGNRSAIAGSKRIANPGCHASGFVSLIAPLVEQGMLKPDAQLSCFSLTGYSGGGKNMIADYNAPGRSPLLDGPRQYGLTQSHKHLPEMVKVCGLEHAPVFCPIVGDFYSGMEVTVPLFASDVKGGIEEIKNLYKNYYTSGLVKFAEDADPDGMLSAAAFSGKDNMSVSVYGNDERIILVSRFDNLGKGASGAAIQNMNIVLGIDESTGLNV